MNTININQCIHVNELTILPGIGNKTAAAILKQIKIKPLNSTDDLISRKIKGLTANKLKKISKTFKLSFQVNSSASKQNKTKQISTEQQGYKQQALAFLNQIMKWQIVEN